MAEAFRAIIVGLALTIAFAFLPAPAHSQAIGTGPKWGDLSAPEKQVLAPLASDWDGLDLRRKNKWLAMSKRYPTLPAAEQERIQARMHWWAKLSTEERQAAREKFRGMKQLPPDQRRELSNKWMEYQSLPQEQRQELRKATPPPRPVSPGQAQPPGGRMPAIATPPAK